MARIVLLSMGVHRETATVAKRLHVLVRVLNDDSHRISWIIFLFQLFRSEEINGIFISSSFSFHLAPAHLTISPAMN